MAVMADLEVSETVMAWTWMIVWGTDHCVIVGMLLPNIVLSILWMRTRRRAAVPSFGFNWSWGWTWMMNAEVAAENRPAYNPGQHVTDPRNIEDTQRSGLRSSLRPIS